MTLVAKELNGKSNVTPGKQEGNRTQGKVQKPHVWGDFAFAGLQQISAKASQAWGAFRSPFSTLQMQVTLPLVFILWALPAAGTRQHQPGVLAPQAANGKGSCSDSFHHNSTRRLTLSCVTVTPGKNRGFSALQMACHRQLKRQRVSQTLSDPCSSWDRMMTGKKKNKSTN